MTKNYFRRAIANVRYFGYDRDMRTQRQKMLRRERARLMRRGVRLIGRFKMIPGTDESKLGPEWIADGVAAEGDCHVLVAVVMPWDDEPKTSIYRVG